MLELENARRTISALSNLPANKHQLITQQVRLHAATRENVDMDTYISRIDDLSGLGLRSAIYLQASTSLSRSRCVYMQRRDSIVRVPDVRSKMQTE